MSAFDGCIGRVVTSRAGRDAGRSFLIVAVADEDHVLIVDGTLRKLSKPKKKKLKHLHVEADIAEGIKEKLSDGKQVFDAEIRNCLHNLGYNSQEQE